MSKSRYKMFRTTASTSEQFLPTAGAPVLCGGILNDVLTTGTLTIRNGTTVVAILQAGIPRGTTIDFAGAYFDKGFSIQQSVTTDQCTVFLEPA